MNNISKDSLFKSRILLDDIYDEEEVDEEIDFKTLGIDYQFDREYDE